MQVTAMVPVTAAFPRPIMCVSGPAKAVRLFIEYMNHSSSLSSRNSGRKRLRTLSWNCSRLTHAWSECSQRTTTFVPTPTRP